MATLGIDFGTANLRIVAGAAQDRLSPSAVVVVPAMIAFRERHIAVGDAVPMTAGVVPDIVVRGAKRLLGKSAEEPFVTTQGARAGWAATEVDGDLALAAREGDEVKGSMRLCDGIAELLRHAASIAAEGGDHTAVVAIPAWFGAREREALLRAFGRARIRVQRFVQDATAAALWELEGQRSSGRMLSLAVGAGGVSGSLLQLDAAAAELCASSGSCHFGGDDVDAALAGAVLAEPDRRSWELVLQASEALKRELGKRDSASREVALAEGTIKLSVDRWELELILGGLAKSVGEHVARLLKDSDTRPETLDVIGVGGMMLLPELLKPLAALGARSVKLVRDELDAPVLGAARLAQALGGGRALARPLIDGESEPSSPEESDAERERRLSAPPVLTQRSVLRRRPQVTVRRVDPKDARDRRRRGDRRPGEPDSERPRDSSLPSPSERPPARESSRPPLEVPAPGPSLPPARMKRTSSTLSTSDSDPSAISGARSATRAPTPPAKRSTPVREQSPSLDRTPTPLPGRTLKPGAREPSPSPDRAPSPLPGRASSPGAREPSPSPDRAPTPLPGRVPSPTPQRAPTPAPRHSTPRHSTPRHSTPRHSTPRHSTPVREPSPTPDRGPTLPPGRGASPTPQRPPTPAPRHSTPAREPPPERAPLAGRAPSPAPHRGPTAPPLRESAAPRRTDTPPGASDPVAGSDPPPAQRWPTPRPGHLQTPRWPTPRPAYLPPPPEPARATSKYPARDGMPKYPARDRPVGRPVGRPPEPSDSQRGRSAVPDSAPPRRMHTTKPSERPQPDTAPPRSTPPGDPLTSEGEASDPRPEPLSSIPPPTAPSLPPRDLPTEGTLFAPRDAAALLALPMTRPLTVADLEPIALPVLLRRLLARSNVFGTLEIRSKGFEVRVDCEAANASLTKSEHHQLIKAFDLPRAEWRLLATREEEPNRESFPLARLALDGVRKRLREEAADNCEKALGDRLARTPRVRPDRKSAPKRLGLNSRELRVVESYLDGSASGADIARSGPVGRSTCYQLFILLELYDVIEWHDVVAKKEPSPAELLEARAHELAGQNHFDALGVHWTATDAEITARYQRLSDDYGTSSDNAQQNADACRRVRTRLRDAFEVLSHPERRIAYRNQVYAGHDFAAAVDLAAGRMRAMTLRGMKAEAKQQEVAAKELSRSVGTSQFPARKPEGDE